MGGEGSSDPRWRGRRAFPLRLFWSNGFGLVVMGEGRRADTWWALLDDSPPLLSESEKAGGMLMSPRFFRNQVSTAHQASRRFPRLLIIHSTSGELISQLVRHICKTRRPHYCHSAHAERRSALKLSTMHDVQGAQYALRYSRARPLFFSILWPDADGLAFSCGSLMVAHRKFFGTETTTEVSRVFPIRPLFAYMPQDLGMESPAAPHVSAAPPSLTRSPEPRRGITGLYRGL